MTSFRVCIHDASYKVVDGKPFITLFGRAEDERLVTVLIDTFLPYFVIRAQPEHLNNVRTVKDGEMCVVDIIPLERAGQHDLYKVVCNVPKAVPLLRKQAEQFVDYTYEYDIPYARRFLLDNGVMPFTVLRIEGECKNNVIHAQTIVVDRPVLPKLRALAFDIEVYNPRGKHVYATQDPIVMLALYGEHFKKVLTWKHVAAYDDYVEVVKSEKELLERFVAYVQSIDPDCLVGYFSDGFDLPYIIKRAHVHGVDVPLGVLHAQPKVSKGMGSAVKVYGRTHVDILQFIRHVYGKSMKTDRFTLNAVAQEILLDKKTDVNLDTLASAWDTSDPLLATFAAYNLHDARLTYQLFAYLLPNILEMMNIIGLPMYDVIRFSYSQLVEWFVIRKAVNKQYLIPNKPSGAMIHNRDEERAQGAFVFEPEPGMYRDIAVFDYRSLYPTIIASHNISPDTLNCSCCSEKVPELPYHFCTQKKGFLSGIISELIEARDIIKQQLRTESRPELVARSYGLKVLANAFYGYLGFSHARWYCHQCVESTTAWGRYHIRTVIDAARNAGYTVIYSDTDSVFLCLGDQTLDDAKRFVHTVNQKLPGLMELDFEAFYPRGLFVATRKDAGGAKKRYALIDSDNTLKIRGFETVRRNYSMLGKRIQRDVLRILLEAEDTKRAVIYVKDILNKLKNHDIPIADLIIETQLSKSVEEYASVGPHVAAAKRMKERGEYVAPGVPIQYVVGCGQGKIRDKVRLPEEVSPSDIDTEYYINHQILPAIGRIFEVVGVHIAEEIKPTSQQHLGQFF